MDERTILGTRISETSTKYERTSVWSIETASVGDYTAEVWQVLRIRISHPAPHPSHLIGSSSLLPPEPRDLQVETPETAGNDSSPESSQLALLVGRESETRGVAPRL